MSKSLGNTILLKDLRKEQHPETVKYAMLQNSYHNDTNFSDNIFKEAENHIYSFHKTIKAVEDTFKTTSAVNTEIEKEFNESMNDDFNTARAIGNLFKYFKTINQKLKANDDSALADVKAIKEAYSILGLFVNNSNDVIAYVENKNTADIPQEVKDLAEARKEAKANKDYAKADEIRSQITALGYVVKDSKDGYTIEKA